MNAVGQISLRPVIRARITTLVDNYSDVFLKTTDRVHRPPMAKDGKRTRPLLAEHGFSVMVEAWDELDHHAVIMDFGVSHGTNWIITP